MKNRTSHYTVRTSLLMLLSFLFVLGVTLPVFSTIGTTAKNVARESQIQESDIPSAVGTKLAAERGHALRLRASEHDLNTVVFRNDNQTQTMYIFDYPVKYIDTTGETRDISLEIADSGTEQGAFMTKAAHVQTYFSKNLSDGVTVSADDVSIRSVPVTPASVSTATMNASRVNAETISYPYGEKTSIEYSLTYTGYKEDIVVSSYTGQTEYQFRLYTNGLLLHCEDGSYYLKDETGEIRATIGDIIVFTADNRNNYLGSMTHVTVCESEEYLLTIHLDADYLRDEKTVYPIRIDPTIEITYDQDGEGAIEDTTINSLQGSSGSSGSLFIGKRETYGISRVLMRFPTFPTDLVASTDQILRAEVEMRDVLCESDAMSVYCYVFTGGDWEENTASWSAVSPNSYGPSVGSNTISYANGSANSHCYSFTITNAVIGWLNGTYDLEQGILFKASSSVENASAYLHKTFASYNRASYKPSMRIVYTNPFYSQFDDSTGAVVAKGSGTLYSSASLLQKRANCYGYALQTHLSSHLSLPNIYGYFHLPGEFADKSGGLTISPNASLSYTISTRADLENLWTDTLWAMIQVENFESSAKLAFHGIMQTLLRKDIEAMGYSVTFTSAAAVKAPTTASRRLVIMVAGADAGPDYHFYLQHTDGSWSHKRGNTAATTQCICKEVDSLDSDSIIEHVQDGGYDDYITYFYVTKPAIFDFGNANGYLSTLTKTETEYVDLAGDVLENAQKIVVPESVQGRFDYAGDVDTYVFNATSTRYQINLQKINSTEDDYSITVLLRDENGSMVNVSTISGDSSVFFPTIDPGVYYLSVYIPASTTFKSGRCYRLSFVYLTT